MPGALSKITTRAKQIRKKHPNMKWSSAIKQAGVDYRAGKIGGVKKKRVGSVKKKTAKKTRRAPAKQKTVAKVRVSVSGITAVQHMGHAKKQLREEIGWLEAGKFTATTVKAKRALQKRINEKKRIYRKLS